MKEAADAELAGHYDLIDRRLAGREWLVGGKRTVADLLGPLPKAPAWDSANLRAHWLRTLELGGAQRMIAEQCLELPDFAPPRPR